MAQKPYYRKALGQHHLRDGTLCRPLIDFLAPQDMRVLEIGPGGGVLTGELRAAGARLLACELDPAWALYLRRQRAGQGLALAVLDALDFPWARLPAPTLVAGNLPYQIATRLITDLLPHAARLPRAAFLVQREVAARLVAQPGDKAYGALSVLVASCAKAYFLATVPPNSFRPPPKVTSAFVGLRLHPPPLPTSRLADFRAVVHQAFALRRKTLRNSLAAGWGRPLAEAVLTELGLDTRCRAESLALTTFVAMTDTYQRLRQG